MTIPRVLKTIKDGLPAGLTYLEYHLNLNTTPELFSPPYSVGPRLSAFRHGLQVAAVVCIPAGNMYTGWAFHCFVGILMEWTTPQFEEVCLNCEINSYASAQL